MNNLQSLAQTLERLESHLDAVQDGSLTARDDLASTLQILIHPGRGHDLINKTFRELGIPEMEMPSFQNDLIERTVNSNEVILGVRAINLRKPYQAPFSRMLNQEVIIHNNSTWTTAPSLSWRDIVAKSRNNFGSHIGDSPPEWLKDLRYYPAANADVMTLLLWSLGEALLAAITSHLASHGQGFMLYMARDSLNGIVFESSNIIALSEHKIDISADIMVTDNSTQRRTIMGGVYDGKPFILEINDLRRPEIFIGNSNEPLDVLKSRY